MIEKQAESQNDLQKAARTGQSYNELHHEAHEEELLTMKRMKKGLLPADKPVGADM
jgi:hypothetical protein